MPISKGKTSRQPDTIRENNALISYLNAILQKVSNHAEHVDSQTNIMIAISSGLFIFSASKIYTPQGTISWPMVIFIIFTGLAEIVAIFSVNPPRLMEKKPKESVFYHREIASLPGADEYYQRLIHTTDDIHKIIKEYADEIYNLSKNSYLPKRKLFRLSRNLLILGVLFSALAFLCQQLLHFL